MKQFNLHRKKLGSLGEHIATSYLQKQGYTVIDRNFKARYGELDIVAVKDATLIICEVKTRIGSSFGKPEEAITPHKLRELVQTTAYYVLTHAESPKSQRIDLIAISLNEDKTIQYIKHIENISG